MVQFNGDWCPLVKVVLFGRINSKTGWDKIAPMVVSSLRGYSSGPGRAENRSARRSYAQKWMRLRAALVVRLKIITHGPEVYEVVFHKVDRRGSPGRSIRLVNREKCEGWKCV